jgi:hypothetical protein
MPRTNWSRPLPRPLVIPTVLTLTTLADVRELIEKHLPLAHREKATWRYVSNQLAKAARDGNTIDVSVALQIALQLEGVRCRPKRGGRGAAWESERPPGKFPESW